MDLKCETRNTEMALSYNTEMQITNAAFNVNYSIGENLQKAALNTLLGMGTVFVILILISFDYFLIRYSFPKIEKSKQKQEPKEAEKQRSTQRLLLHRLQHLWQL